MAQKSDFGMASSSLILDKLRGEDVVLVASYFKQNVLVLITQKNIKNIQQLKGKKIMALPYELKHTSLGIMLEQNGLKKGDYKLVKDDFGVDKFVNKKVDAMSAFITNQPYLLDKAGVAYNIINPAKFGLFSYDLELFTSQKFRNKNPQLVENFVKATNEGWAYAFAHKREIVDLIYNKYSQKKSKDALMYEAMETQKLFKTNIFAIGAIVPELIYLNAQIYAKSEFSEKKIDLMKLIASYTDKPLMQEYQPKFYSVKLTKKEKEYLKHKVVKFCIDPAWMPFEALKDNHAVGMSADYFKIIRKNLNMTMKLVPTNSWSQALQYVRERKCDIVTLAMKTPERSKYLNFTSAYLSVPLVVITKTDVPFIADFSTLTKKETLAIPKDYAYTEFLRKKYPNLKLVFVKNIKDGLEKVRQGEVFGYLGSLATTGYMLQKDYIGELKIAGKFNKKWNLGVGVRNDDETLLHILQKGILSVTLNERKDILNRWIAVNYEKGEDYKLVFQVIGIAFFVIFIIIFWNIKLSKLNQKLHMAKEKSEELHQEKSNFLANMSHEIRTPMNSILGTAYLLKETTLNETQKKYIKKIENATNNLLQLINDILDLSKLEAKKTRLSKKKFSLLEIFDTLNNMFNQELYEKNLQFNIEYDDTLPMYLHDDNVKLLQVLTNLLSNAIKFTSEGTIVLHVEYLQNNLFRFRLKDNGIGIQQSKIKDIFASFTQADSNTTRRYGGTGLGLAISKELVELMDGKIWVHSEVNVGSEFIFEIHLHVIKEKKHLQKSALTKIGNIEEISKKDDISQEKLEKLFEELKIATHKKRPKLCQPMIQEIEQYTLPPKQQQIFNMVKALIKKYKFNEAEELL